MFPEARRVESPLMTPLVRIAILFASLPLAVLAAWATGSEWAGLAVFAAGVGTSWLLRVFRRPAIAAVRRDQFTSTQPPVRTLLAVFMLTAVAAGVGDFFITSARSVALSAALGIGCGFAVIYVVRSGGRRDPGN
jgi:hypothetical protein